MTQRHFIECPYCHYEFDDEETWHSRHSIKSEVSTCDGDESVVQCHNSDCEKTFKVLCEYVAMFVSEEI